MERHDPFTEATDRALYALGLFIACWSIVEATLEMAIAVQLGLNHYDASVITAGMQFKPKRLLLQGLLTRDCVKYASAIKALDEIGKRPERNDAVHSVIGYNKDGIVFTRRKSHGKFTSTEKEYTAAQLIELSVEIAGICEKLKTELGISDQDYVSWLQEAHKAANKPA